MKELNPKEVGTEIECPGSSRCTCRISFFHAGDRTQMTTKEGRRLMGRVKNSEPEEPQHLGLRFASSWIECRS